MVIEIFHSIPWCINKYGQNFYKINKTDLQAGMCFNWVSNIKEHIVKPIFEIVSKQLTCLFPNVEQSKYLTLSCTGGGDKNACPHLLGLSSLMTCFSIFCKFKLACDKQQTLIFKFNIQNLELTLDPKNLKLEGSSLETGPPFMS